MSKLSARVDKLEALAGDPEPVELTNDELSALLFRLHQEAERKGLIVKGPWGFYTVAASVTDPDTLDFCEWDCELSNEVQRQIYEDHPQAWIDLGPGKLPYPVSIEAGGFVGELLTLEDVQNSAFFDQQSGVRLRKLETEVISDETAISAG